MKAGILIGEEQGVSETVKMVRLADELGYDSVWFGEHIGIREARKPVSDTTCYNVLARNSLVEAEKRVQTQYMNFEMSHPDELVQAGITSLNGVSIMTMEDDYSRMGWAASIQLKKGLHTMKTMHPDKYENLIIDNGSQFSKKNSNMKNYCEESITGIHIWASIYHPQTMGKYTEGISKT